MAYLYYGKIMLKKGHFFCLWIPLSLNAANIGLSKEFIATQCWSLSIALNPIIERQMDIMCDTQLNLAKLYLGNAASEILANKRADNLEYLNLSATALYRTEFYGCVQPNKIHEAQVKVQQIINRV